MNLKTIDEEAEEDRSEAADKEQQKSRPKQKAACWQTSLDRFIAWYKTHKKISIPLTVVIL